MDKLNKCYNIGNLIINKYIDLLSFSIYFGGNKQNKNLINEIKSLVIEEYKLYSTMSLDEINKYLVLLADENLYDDKSTISRMNDKLGNLKEIINGRYFSSGDLNKKTLFGDMKFSIYDVMLSIINIESIKKIKRKIDSLRANNDNDESFVKQLRYRLELSKNELLFSLSTSEMLAIHADMDIDKIENLDVFKLNKLLSKYVDDKYIRDSFYNTAAVYMKNILDRVANLYVDNSNPDDVFYYLSLITRIEILVGYMNKMTLNIIYDYCDMLINEDNKRNIEMVKRLIKAKI